MLLISLCMHIYMNTKTLYLISLLNQNFFVMKFFLLLFLGLLLDEERLLVIFPKADPDLLSNNKKLLLITFSSAPFCFSSFSRLLNC